MAVMGRAADKKAVIQGFAGSVPFSIRLLPIRMTIKAMNIPREGWYPLAVKQRLRKA